MKTTFLNLCLLLAVIAMGHIPIFGQTIINDHFNGTVINTNVWTVITPFCDSEMYESNGVAVFENCGTLLTKSSLPSQIQVSGNFMLTNSQYGKLQIYTRTTGAMSPVTGSVLEL
jgi:hypothetical protein